MFDKKFGIIYSLDNPPKLVAVPSPMRIYVGRRILGAIFPNGPKLDLENQNDFNIFRSQLRVAERVSLFLGNGCRNSDNQVDQVEFLRSKLHFGIISCLDESIKTQGFQANDPNDSTDPVDKSVISEGEIIKICGACGEKRHITSRITDGVIRRAYE